MASVRLKDNGSLKKIQDKLNKLKGTAQLLKNKKLTKAVRFKFKLSRDDSQKLIDTIKSAPALLDRAVDFAMKSMAPEIKQALDDAMNASVWDWKGDSRDIVDTGKLRDSALVYYRDGELQIKYGEVYAMIVHYGGYVKSGYQPEVKIYYPGRPWIEAVVNGNGPVQRYPFEERFLHFVLEYIYDKKPLLRP